VTMADKSVASARAATSSANSSSVLGRLQHWFSKGQRHSEIKPERWIIVDVETSGLDNTRDHLLSIGAVAMVGREIMIDDSFEALIGQTEASSHENIVIHGISGSAQRGGQAEGEVLRAFESWCNRAPMLGWHIGFDLGFLRPAYVRHKIEGPTRDNLDLAPLAQVLLEDRSNSLDDYLNKLGIVVQSRHSAAADAWMTALLAARLYDAASRQGACDFRSLRLLAANARWAPG
jgi:DNA polymerase III subunit epsilon